MKAQLNSVSLRQLLKQKLWDQYLSLEAKVSDLLELFIDMPARQLVGKTRWVFRRPNGSNPTNHPV
jgi:hypothetical protein